MTLTAVQTDTGLNLEDGGDAGRRAVSLQNGGHLKYSAPKNSLEWMVVGTEKILADVQYIAHEQLKQLVVIYSSINQAESSMMFSK
ncbi:hypothetical protein TNCV_3706971 [Trichonephila clavipes]|nr:hypothetical protein TNCV_3706971 [Trichonephila clavipes]